MRNYRITVAYDGTKYNGWQRQGNTQNTVQGKIEDILTKMTGHAVEIHGSGRTDKGVHAKAQVANFKIDTHLTAAEICDYINKYLPAEIGVLQVCEAEDRFHARLCAKKKTYMYRIWNSNMHNPFEHRFVHSINEKLDLEVMRKTAKLFVGKHDFMGFSSLKRSKKSTVRNIYKFEIYEKGDEIDFVVTGDGFLYNMVRIMSGTVLEAGLGKRSPESVFDVFESRDRNLAGETLPAKGLTLLNVDYD